MLPSQRAADGLLDRAGKRKGLNSHNIKVQFLTATPNMIHKNIFPKILIFNMITFYFSIFLKKVFPNNEGLFVVRWKVFGVKIKCTENLEQHFFSSQYAKVIIFFIP